MAFKDLRYKGVRYTMPDRQTRLRWRHIELSHPVPGVREALLRVQNTPKMFCASSISHAWPYSVEKWTLERTSSDINGRKTWRL
jgi:hypothetical protein